MIYRRYGKRLFDLVAAGLGLMILSPLFLVIAVLIKAHDGGPVFFRQVRVGRGGRLFRIFKFRTMVVNAEQMGAQLTTGKDPRITGIGRFLRKYKLDELPQLLNVVKGDMSLVGPRPEVPRYVAIFARDYKKILTVRPGITDYASLVYRNENELLDGADDPEKMYVKKVLPEKIKMNYRYIETMGFIVDIKIILSTIFNREL